MFNAESLLQTLRKLINTQKLVEAPQSLLRVYFQMNTKERKKEAKLEKKKRQGERHRQKYLDSLRGNDSQGASNYNDADLAREVGMLKI